MVAASTTSVHGLRALLSTGARLLGAAALASSLTACLLAPPRPEGGGGDGGVDGGPSACTVPADARLTATTAILTPAGDTLVRAGMWGGELVVNLYLPGAGFDGRCPTLSLPVNVELSNISAITPTDRNSVLVLGVTGTDRTIVEVPLDPAGGGSVMLGSVGVDASAGAEFIAFRPPVGTSDTSEVLFGVGKQLWRADGGLGMPPELVMQSAPDEFSAATPLTGGHPAATWAMIGRLANYQTYIGVDRALNPVLQSADARIDHGICTEFVSCPPRASHAPHVAPLGADGPLAYSISRSTSGDLRFVRTDGTVGMLAVAPFPPDEIARDVALVAVQGALVPLVLTSLAPGGEHVLVFGTTPPPIAAGNPGPKARLVTGAFRPGGGVTVLVLSELPGAATPGAGCWTLDNTVASAALVPCD